MTLDSLFQHVGPVAEIAVLIFLIRARGYRTLPIFCLYIVESIANDLAFFLFRDPASDAYLRVYTWGEGIQSIFEFGVLVELAWSVLLPIRKSLPKWSWAGVAFLIGLAGLALWPVAGIVIPHGMSPLQRNLFHVEQTVAILRVISFLGLAAFSQLLAINWRNRELQIATGLGAYSLISLAILIMHTHQVPGPQYHLLDQIEVASYLGALAYWGIAFATKEEERREFSPQMQNFLLLLGGTARTSRIALGNFPVTKSRHEDHQ